MEMSDDELDLNAEDDGEIAEETFHLSGLYFSLCENASYLMNMISVLEEK